MGHLGSPLVSLWGLFGTLSAPVLVLGAPLGLPWSSWGAPWPPLGHFGLTFRSLLGDIWGTFGSLVDVILDVCEQVWVHARIFCEVISPTFRMGS